MEYERAEYEMQQFNFSVAQMKLEHRVMVKKQIEILTEKFADSIIKKSNISEPIADQIRNKSNLVNGKIVSAIENELKNFDDLLQKHFTIPDNVLLAEDLRHEDSCCEADEKRLEERLLDLETTYKQNKYLLPSLEAELQMYADLEPAIELENEVMNKVEDSFKTKLNFNDVKETMEKAGDVLNVDRA